MSAFPALREALECPNLDAPMHTSTNCTYCAHVADARDEFAVLLDAVAERDAMERELGTYPLFSWQAGLFISGAAVTGFTAGALLVLAAWGVMSL